MPFKGRAGEGRASIGLLRKPKGVARPPVVAIWGGIDAFKEERPSDPYLRAGLATLCIDMPGVADAPLPGSENAERLWDAVFDYIAGRSDLDANRVGIHGGSTGGYWATKVAHTHSERLRAAVAVHCRAKVPVHSRTGGRDSTLRIGARLTDAGSCISNLSKSATRAETLRGG